MNNNVSQKDVMEKTSDQWLWFVDDELIEALARQDVLDPKSEKRPVQSAALVKALALNTEGKTEEALREVAAALDRGEVLHKTYPLRFPSLPNRKNDTRAPST